MTLSKNSLNANKIKRSSKNFILISLLCLVFLQLITPISSLEENTNKTHSIHEKSYKKREQSEKRQKVKACELLIKVRLAQDIVFIY